MNSLTGNSGEAYYYGPMTSDEVKEIIRQVEYLVGKLGQSYAMDEGDTDSELYEYQVHCGLAEAVGEILRDRPEAVAYWLGVLVIQLGYDPHSKEFIEIRNRLEHFFANSPRE